MPNIQEPIQNFNDMLFLPEFGFAWILFVVLASVVYRKVKGRPLYPRIPVDAIFSQKWASGRSNKNLITKIGGARNCLLVAITPNYVVVTPQFPFNLLFLPEIYGLEYRIKRDNIRGASEHGRWPFKAIRLEFTSGAGKILSIGLNLKDPELFLEKLRGARTF